MADLWTCPLDELVAVVVHRAGGKSGAVDLIKRWPGRPSLEDWNDLYRMWSMITGPGEPRTLLAAAGVAGQAWTVAYLVAA